MGLDTLGLLLRIWLWISVPMAAIILLVATWMNYVRNIKPKTGLQLAIEGLVADVPPGGGGMGGDIYTRKEDVVGEGEALLDEGGETVGGGEEEVAAFAEASAAEEELTATGRETIYQGILWMKAKYEEYREQADRQLAAVRVQLGLKQGIINELEAQLRLERMKVEDLVAQLQDKSLQEGQSIPDLGK
jgi:hypothetical protein